MKTNKDWFRVLIVGCGELGSRHLQAVASLPQVGEIEVIDPRPEALARGRERLAEVPDRQPSTICRWLSSIEEASKGGDLCIVATQADVRCEVVRQVAGSFGYASFLLEKMVAQSVRDYEELMRLAEARSLGVWVNCKQRAEPLHRAIKGKVNPSEQITMSVVGGNHGLATSGIHSADLFVFLDRASHIYSSGSKIDQVLHPSKRGAQVFDLSGTLHGFSEKGSRFALSFMATSKSPDHVSIVTPRYRWIIDRQFRWVFESSADCGWSWNQIPLENNLMVSNMAKAFAADILSKGNCELPTLQECFPAHDFILSALQPHFNKLLGKELDRCPVT